MASHIKTQLTQISTSAGGTHRDLAEKYKVVLEAILKLGEQDNLLRSIVNFSIGCLSLLCRRTWTTNRKVVPVCWKIGWCFDLLWPAK